MSKPSIYQTQILFTTSFVRLLITSLETNTSQEGMNNDRMRTHRNSRSGKPPRRPD